MVLNRLTYPKLPYAEGDLTGISTVASSPIVFAVRPSLPVNNLQELVRLAKSKPDAVQFATVGSGGSTRVVLELLNQATGAGIKYIPYKGAAPGITDILAGNVDGMGVDLPALLPFIRDGKLRGIAITSENRNPLLPDLRTAAEQGVPELTCGNWYAVVAPSRTPRPVIERLQREVVAALANPDVRRRLADLNVEAQSSSPEQAAALLASEVRRWGDVIVRARIPQQ
jgi:tripartite-type tricarboxylate transporter receptor subunit TctC